MKWIIQSLLTVSLLIPTTTSLANTVTKADPFALRVAKEGDLQMSCSQLVEEAALMREIIQTTQTIKNEADFNGNAVTAIGAVGSFLTSTMTAGLSLAAAGFVAGQEAEDQEDNADNTQDIATQRRALISGIYTAKDCPAKDIEHAMSDPLPVSQMAIFHENLAQIQPSSGYSGTSNYND